MSDFSQKLREMQRSHFSGGISLSSFEEHRLCSTQTNKSRREQSLIGKVSAQDLLGPAFDALLP